MNLSCSYLLNLLYRLQIVIPTDNGKNIKTLLQDFKNVKREPFTLQAYTIGLNREKNNRRQKNSSSSDHATSSLSNEYRKLRSEGEITPRERDAEYIITTRTQKHTYTHSDRERDVITIYNICILCVLTIMQSVAYCIQYASIYIVLVVQYNKILSE